MIVGAAVGTTSTGWIVSLLGLKFNVGTVALPLIGVGALLRLFSSGRKAHIGMALAGFGLIFVGIELLRASMGDVAAQFDLTGLAGPTVLAHLQLVAIGIAMTVVLQSSSAAVALALTAVHSDAITIEQAAYLVIGQNVGTTVTSALAAIGGSVPARRTAVGHMLFNTFAGLVAFLAARPLLGLSTDLALLAGADDVAVVVAIFHTVFNVAGAIVILPLLHPFARFVTRLVPEKRPGLTRHLDRTLLEIPAVAIDAADRTVRDIARITFAEARRSATTLADRQARLEEPRLALDETHRFLGNVRSSRDERSEVARRLSLLHAGDHLGRLITSLRRFEPGPVMEGVAEITDAQTEMNHCLDAASAWLETRGDAKAVVANLARSAQQQAALRKQYREALLTRTASGELLPHEASRQLDVMRHADQVIYHVWRVIHHLALPSDETAFEPENHVAAEH